MRPEHPSPTGGIEPVPRSGSGGRARRRRTPPGVARWWSPWAGITSLLSMLSVVVMVVAGPASAQDSGGGSGGDSSSGSGSPTAEISLDAPRTLLSNVPFEQSLEASIRPQGRVEIEVNGQRTEVPSDAWSQIEDDIGYTATVEELVVEETGEATLRLFLDGNQVTETTTDVISGWMSVMPAVLAILLALITRQVIPSLFLGILLGSWMSFGLTLPGLWYGLLDTIQVYILEALVPSDGSKGHMSVVVFTLMMGGLIGIIYKNGGAHAIADRISAKANNRRSGQLATSGLGFAIFFSTYANSLIVGNTMRPVTDRLKISREKLAYVIDSTAAPLASIAIISTWIGYQLGLIDSAVQSISGFSENAYSIFLKSIPYNFYPILALFTVLMVAASGRDFGPMLKAEKRAMYENKLMRDGAKVDDNAKQGAEEEGGALSIKEGVKRRSINAILPIGTLIVTVAAGLYLTGEGDTLREIIGSAQSSRVLVWAGLLGVLVAALLSIGQRILTIGETVDAWYAGLKTVMFVMIILTLAWSLAAIAVDLKTANYLVEVLGDTIAPQYLPAILFVLAAAVSFSVGTSWGTMGILMPLAVPLIWQIMQGADMTGGQYDYILYATIGTILAGSVWGDHCSPISDTTIISSVAAGSDHIDHVRTQIPYALLVGFVSILFGLIPVGFGIPWWICLPAGAAAIAAFLFVVGEKIDDRSTDSESESSAQKDAAESRQAEREEEPVPAE